MNAALSIVACTPDDALFSEVLRRIYPDDFTQRKDSKADEDYLLRCFVLLNGTEAIGRIAVYHNTALMHLGNATAQAGAFECINDASAAKALIEACMNVAREAGAAAVIGPMAGSTWNQYRFISESSGAPQFFTAQAHPDYYPALWRMLASPFSALRFQYGAGTG